MLGFHKRTRSLIPVKDLAKYDKILLNEETDVEENEWEPDMTPEIPNKARGKQLMLVYAIFLAEA